ncbi:NUDIX hydrolase [Diaphorobacter sp.]|uniref:NUDIX hydrolase n=1 Tax=Diaphorobacter sp. TaxID=1934310 RepID=UPI0028A9495A|nr:NUDIX domain-containing protein [Diaphorobacter sp.]
MRASAQAATPAPAWLAQARTHAQRAPLAPRVPLWVAGYEVGSVEPQVLDGMAARGALPAPLQLQPDAAGWRVDCAPAHATAALNALAHALREDGACGPWRNEQLAVCHAGGERIGTIERGAVRPLGIVTHAVHLVGHAPDGSIWVQQRAFNKPNNPGMWDTLMGGMVSAQDSLAQALARETWEEAGLRVDDLRDVRHGGHVDFAQPAEEEDNHGYMRERIDWFSATVPDGMAPENQDGEVERFERLPPDEVQARLARAEFTPEAALILAAYFGW